MKPALSYAEPYQIPDGTTWVPERIRTWSTRVRTGTLKQQIQKAITAYGTKASNYSVLAKTEQIRQLGVALDAIQKRFSVAYGPVSGSTAWYGMDVEFKFDDEEAPGQLPNLHVKPARPYHGRAETP